MNHLRRFLKKILFRGKIYTFPSKFGVWKSKTHFCKAKSVNIQKQFDVRIELNLIQNIPSRLKLMRLNPFIFSIDYLLYSENDMELLSRQKLTAYFIKKKLIERIDPFIQLHECHSIIIS